ncbi:MAG TPA: aldehyde dehydrogenase family protein [Nocardioides sp.]|uniref:aldehyde dehydrogenase family protein n=1 Tax=Nocardioides sp. TaxID=35761 RepID=UPI002C14FAC3|nr:aldehyde dehydrogenase family protein [Nocardioides sp.]HTW14403.1 aldehyde dehydrogenase family protein [Nocardioides sp.]
MTSLLDPAVWSGRVFDGTWRESAASLTTAEPATGLPVGTVGTATPEDVLASVAVARRAQREWAAAGYHVRAGVLRRAAQVFTENAADIADLFAREAGAPQRVAGPQASISAEECFEAAALAAMPAGDLLRSMQPRLSMARRVPVGVVGVIAPFNSPILLALRAVAPALALGNAVVLKPDPRTAVVGGVLLARAFEEAGLPAGLLHVLPGGVDVGEAIVAHPDVPVLAFTGSTGAGKAIAASAAANLKRTHLELGGNSASIVLEDADVEAAAAAGAWGSFRHAGQICMATGRHLVHESVADLYVAGLAAAAAGLRLGDPARTDADVGPIIDAAQRDRVHRMVTDSVAAGARLVTGGEPEGPFYRPTVLAGVPADAPAYRDEVFGPVASVVTFASDEEAIALASDTPYGLALGVFTRDVMRGLALAERIPAGLVHINDQTINDEPVAPFGGVGHSGNGARHGGHEANLEAFTELQWVTVRGSVPVYPW